MTLKQQCNNIWERKGVANACHVTGWLDKEGAQQRKLGFYDVTYLMPYKCRKLSPKLINRKAAIFKHQRLG